VHAVFGFKLALAGFSVVASIALVFIRASGLERPAPGAIIVGYYAARIALLAVLFLGLGFQYPQENTTAYVLYGDMVSRGAIPDRDFFVVYGLLFSYVVAIPLLIVHHPFGLFALFQLIEGGSVYAIFTQRNDPLSLRGFLSYAVNPVVLVWMWLGLQAQTMCLVPIAVVFAVRNETSRSLLYAFGLAISKVFSLWTIIPALAFQRVRSAIIFGLGVALIHVPFMLVGSSGISFKSTEGNGTLSDNTTGGGIESLLGLVASPVLRTQLAHASLFLTGGLLLAVMAGVLLFRWRIGEANLNEPQVVERRLAYISVFSVILTLIFQAFSPYTTPDYLATAIVLVPTLVKAGFWSRADQVIFIMVTFLQSIVYEVWFHFAEISHEDPRRNAAFLALLVTCNLFTIGFCLTCGRKSYLVLRHELQRLNPA
jgi:hypothetical protein